MLHGKSRLLPLTQSGPIEGGEQELRSVEIEYNEMSARLWYSPPIFFGVATRIPVFLSNLPFFLPSEVPQPVELAIHSL